MAEGIDNIILEQLRLIRGDIARVEERIGDLEGKVDGQTGIIIGLGHYMHTIDHRFEMLERKIGGPT
jgi:hypothetical protein